MCVSKQSRTQGEEDLCAALLGAQPGHLQHLLHPHVAAPARHRRLRKGAVAACIPAQPRQRREYL